MSRTALDATNSPLTDAQAADANRLIQALSGDQRTWLSGYLAGLQAAPGEGAAPREHAAEPHTLTILYGSETGNAEGVAERLGEAALARELPARVVDMADYKPRELRDEHLLLVVTATHGEGDPPDPALDFHEFLHGRKAPRLEGTRFAVLALGDSSYEHFCQTGRDIDARLEALGGERLLERVDCDVDFEEAAEAWRRNVLDAAAAHVIEAPAAAVAAPAQPAVTYDRQTPFHAEVLENQILNGRGSEKATHHIELSLEGSGLDYQPGDILCLMPRNREAVAGELLEALRLDPDQTVASHSGERTLAQALRDDYEITTLTPAFIEAYAELAEAEALKALLAEGKRGELMDYLHGRHIIDVLEEHPLEGGVDAETLLGMMRRLQPREYSIASSHLANPGEVHVTVAAVRYESLGRARHGVASTFLAEQAEPGETVPVYLRRNKHFRLPDDPDTATVMIGPGTGVAPFRAFLQEREVAGAGGANWLFFGNPHFRTDFLYQTEWQRWLKEGVLDRMDVAFSRDGAQKIYVQDRLRERGAELFRWIEAGAHLYVCGDAERMAPDVHAALVEIVAEHGGRSPEEASEYLKQLQRDKRYQRDVY
ncbi:assimilatory sulfite reductase (NADPH) flavoprotein subunit [Modicisalibacter tunisiensis]|uniref:Sulfite reductase [NADPH] flavoprotein alpha-component n=1 Tax=Modicisalibacter tunisiensis TaxID=390637 RepID=A0ABS7WWR1_9GAMM|nr:assimilatory sulfite reductase (NADPH) flavoprotein subunit [Modicisalibacter tunisiensis]MBZ9567047.1 assimilatory sulfite reductase (NADPH) flavoprotein subunit [Modicisalibacter tunisiensis]